MRFWLLSWTIFQDCIFLLLNSFIKDYIQILGYNTNLKSIVLKMLKKRQWLMQSSTLDSFTKYRQQKYLSQGLKPSHPDSILTSFYTYSIIHFFRKRRISKHEPFKTQRLIHTAISLFKHYYLINEYGDNNHVQNALCCIYLSLKINQYTHNQIIFFASQWKGKREEIFSVEECVHFKEEGYSQKEMHFLRGIGFQIGRSGLVAAMEGLCWQIQKFFQERERNQVKQTVQKQPKKANNQENEKKQLGEKQIGIKNKIIQLVLQMVRRVYIDYKAIFLYQGPKLGLAIVLYSARQIVAKSQDQNLKAEDMFEPDIQKVITRNQLQIKQITDYISAIEKYDPNRLKPIIQQVKQQLIKTKKKTFQIPQKKSPKITPLSYQFEQ